MKVIRLTESDINQVIKSSVKRVLKEVYGMDDFGNLSDEEYDELQRGFIDTYEKEDEELKDGYESSVVDIYTSNDDYYPSDGDLYRN